MLLIRCVDFDIAASGIPGCNGRPTPNSPRLDKPHPCHPAWVGWDGLAARQQIGGAYQLDQPERRRRNPIRQWPGSGHTLPSRDWRFTHTSQVPKSLHGEMQRLVGQDAGTLRPAWPWLLG